ncbi:MAG: hypothetical protein HQL94_00875 [Magnetococcales bacterium]|nr:hypothetical protein [Magnetococcales bacterium]MBF0437975.1 hypothetical protein [Magnetococcales bacterium]
MFSLRIISLVCLLSLAVGCSKADDNKKAENKTPPAVGATTTVQSTPSTPSSAVPANHPPVASPAPSQPQQASGAEQPLRIPQSGKVTESKQAGSYTYVQVEADGSLFWLATTQFEPKVGEMVHWDQYSVMKNFFSKTLNQTFPMVLFVGAIHPGPAPAAAAPSKGKAHAVMQSGGYTYVQIDSATGPWLAAPTTQVKEGDTVSWSQGSLMKNFASKGLDRTFEEILFLGGIKVEQK